MFSPAIVDARIVVHLARSARTILVIARQKVLDCVLFRKLIGAAAAAATHRSRSASCEGAIQALHQIVAPVQFAFFLLLLLREQPNGPHLVVVAVTAPTQLARPTARRSARSTIAGFRVAH